MWFHEARVHVGLSFQIYWLASRKPCSTGSRQRESGVWGHETALHKVPGEVLARDRHWQCDPASGGMTVHIRAIVQAGKFAPWQRRVCILVWNYHAGRPLTPAECLHEDRGKFVTGLGTLTNLGILGNIPPHRVRAPQC